MQTTPLTSSAETNRVRTNVDRHRQRAGNVPVFLLAATRDEVTNYESRRVHLAKDTRKDKPGATGGVIRAATHKINMISCCTRVNCADAVSDQGPRGDGWVGRGAFA